MGFIAVYGVKPILECVRHPAALLFFMMAATSACADSNIEETGPNLLANPSFEGGAGENGVPLGWTCYGELDELRKITVVEGAIDEAKAVRIEDDHQQGEVGLRQQVAVEEGKAYVATVSVQAVGRLSPGGSYLQLRFSPSNEFVQRGLMPGLGGAAAEIQVGKVAPPGTTRATLYIYTHGSPRPKVLVDHARLRTVKALPDRMHAPNAAKVPEIAALKPLYLETALLSQGQAASIVVPGDGRYDGAANRIATAMEARAGVRPPMIQDTSFTPALDISAHVIVLGNRSTNGLLATLYERFYTLLDLRYPGAGGYLLRTLHNPTGSGKNVVLVGGSDDEGVERAADVLIEKIGRDIFRLGQSYWPAPDLVLAQPEDLAGVWTVNTLPKAMWRARRNGFALEESFQFASYRTRADASGDYILLDGYNGASRNPYHAFALLELRQDGETILEGYLNQLRTRVDGLTEPSVAMDGALRHRSVLGDLAVAVGEVPKAAHANWRRSIVNRAGRYTLVADALTPRTDTKNFEMQLSWESKRSHWKLSKTEPSRVLATKATDSAMTATVATSRAMTTRLEGMQATLTWVGPAIDGTVQHLFSVVGRGQASGTGGIYTAPLGAAAAAALRLPEQAVAVAGRYADVDAELALLAEDHLYGLGLTTARGFFSADAPVEIFWDYTTGEAIVVAARRTNLRMPLDRPDRLLVDGKDADVSILDGTIHLELAAGRWRLTGALPTAAMLEATRRWLDLTVNEAMVAFKTKSSAPEVAPAKLPALNPESTFDCGEKVTALIQIPLDGRLALAAAAGTTIHLFTEQGTLLKRMETDGPIRMLRWWAEPRLLLAGCVDEKVIAFSDRGERRWIFVSEMDPAVFRAAKTYWFKSAPGHEGIHGLHTGVFLDGKSQAFVGSACTLEIINEQGQLVKRMPQFWGKVSLFKIIPTAENRLTLLAGRKHNGWNSLGVIHNTALDPDQRGFHSVPRGPTPASAGGPV